MSARSAVSVPVLLRYPEGRADGWGRLVELTAAGAVVETRDAVRRGEEAALTFDLFGERFVDFAAEISYAEAGAGGLRVELAWRDEIERRRLARVLLDLLSRSP